MLSHGIVINFFSVIEDLNKQIAALKNRIDCLVRDSGVLWEENIQLRCKNDCLKERLGLNSTSCSLQTLHGLEEAMNLLSESFSSFSLISLGKPWGLIPPPVPQT